MVIRNLARRRPCHAPVSMWRDFDRVFDDLERGLSRPAGIVAHRRRAAAWPRVLLKEDANAYHVIAEVPGVDAQDLEVTVEDGALVLKGSRERYFAPADAAEGEEAPRETFERRVQLRGGVAENDIQAVHRNGVLRVTLPKPNRTVEVTID